MTEQLVVCALGREQYGLPIAQVREIVRFSEPRPVASDVPWMRGVVSLRGRLLPVHDLAARLGVSADGGPAAKLVVLETAAEPVGVLVDDVVEVLSVGAEQIEAVPGGSGRIARVGERLVLLLDGDELGA